jgi:hypothetical protein
MQKATNNSKLIKLLKNLIFFLIIFQGVGTALREANIFVPHPLQITLNENTKLTGSSLMLGNVVAFLNKLHDVNHLLVLRQGENLKYTKHKIIHAYDKRMTRVASSTSLLETVKILNELGINYIVNTYYQDPMISNTFLKEIMNNPKISSLLYSDHYYSVYKISDTNKLEETFPTLNLSISLSNDLLLNFFYDVYKLYNIKNLNENYNYSEYLLEIEVDSTVITTLTIITNSTQDTTTKYTITVVLLPGKNIIKERLISSALTNDLSFLLKTKKNANIRVKKAVITPVRAYQIKSNNIQIPIMIDEKVCRLDNNICKLDELNKKVYPEYQKNEDITLKIKGTGTICHYRKMRLIGFNVINQKSECFSLDNKPLTINLTEDEYLALTTHGAYLEICEAKIAE